MQRRTFVATGLMGLTLGPARAQTAGFTTIFDGKSLDGWMRVGDANVTVADGVVQADKGVGYLVYKDQFGNFEFRAEIFTSDDANSGVFVRFPDKANPSSKDGYEFNIFDQRPDPTYGTGAVVDVAKASVVQKAGGKWNTLEVICRGSELTFRMNGQTTVDKASTGANGHAVAMHGYLGLQFGGGTVRFRNVEIKPL